MNPLKELWRNQCRPIRMIFRGREIIKNVQTIFGDIVAFGGSMFGGKVSKETSINHLRRAALLFNSRKIHDVSILLRQMHLRLISVSYDEIDDELKDFIARGWKNKYWGFLFFSIIDDLPQGFFYNDEEYEEYIQFQNSLQLLRK